MLLRFVGGVHSAKVACVATSVRMLTRRESCVCCERCPYFDKARKLCVFLYRVDCVMKIKITHMRERSVGTSRRVSARVPSSCGVKTACVCLNVLFLAQI